MMKHTAYRLYQKAYKQLIYTISWKEPYLVEGQHAVYKVPSYLQERSIQRVLMVTDKELRKLGLIDGLLHALHEGNIQVTVYDDITPNPTIPTIMKAYTLYKEQQCEALIAFGGGSVIDCAKAVGAKLVRPTKELSQLKGQLHVRKPLPPFIAIPTTAGTGSEATVAAVISNPQTHEKYAINDPVLVPDMAVLDPLLTINLPPHITATTGMDALTHAIEAYIGRSTTALTNMYSEEATRLITTYLQRAYTNPTDIEARQAMQKASYFAGAAFTRAFVGNVHAISHTLSGFYHVPHGLANAVILPHVLESYGATIYIPLSQLAIKSGIGNAKWGARANTELFIQTIRQLNEAMSIPTHLPILQSADIPLMASRAYAEANPLYPVPVIYTKAQFEAMYKKLQGHGAIHIL